MTKERAKKKRPAPEAPGPATEPANPTDPFETWRTFYEANERLWSGSAKETMKSEDFAKAQGKMLETFLALQKTARDSMNAQLGALNLPSRDDLARLGELILGLEEKIDGLDDRLAALEGRLRPATPAAKPAAKPAVKPRATSRPKSASRRRA